jgi:cell wall integrity and stress response component
MCGIHLQDSLTRWVGGGANRWQVFTTGLSRNVVPYAKESEEETDSTTKTSAVSTSAGSVIYKTITQGGTQPTESSDSDSDSGSSTTGIAVGVVVGVVALAAIVGGVYFFLRRRKQKDLDEKQKQADIVNAFVEGGKKPGTSHSSMNDSRLDPDLASRRMSDGSIADNQDYSRRILQVTNPDGY